MESALSLQAVRDMMHLELQAGENYHSRWSALETCLEYSRVLRAQLEEVGRFEANLVNRFSQSVQLAYNRAPVTVRGHSHGAVDQLQAELTHTQLHLQASYSRLVLPTLNGRRS
eukprot:3620651-Amphidinium_carterae.2